MGNRAGTPGKMRLSGHEYSSNSYGRGLEACAAVCTPGLTTSRKLREGNRSGTPPLWERGNRGLSDKSMHKYSFMSA